MDTFCYELNIYCNNADIFIVKLLENGLIINNIIKKSNLTTINLTSNLDLYRLNPILRNIFNNILFEIIPSNNYNNKFNDTKNLNKNPLNNISNNFINDKQEIIINNGIKEHNKETEVYKEKMIILKEKELLEEKSIDEKTDNFKTDELKTKNSKSYRLESENLETDDIDIL